jgi:hypothetical protein
MIILMLTEWPARSPVFRPFWGSFWGVEKRLKNDEKSTSWRKSDATTHAKKLFYIMQHKNFLIHAQQIQQNSARAKKHKKWRFLTPFRRPPKTAIFSPFFEGTEKWQFFRHQRRQQQKFLMKNALTQKKWYIQFGLGSRGVPPHFSMKIVSLIPLILGGAH